MSEAVKEVESLVEMLAATAPKSLLEAMNPGIPTLHQPFGISLWSTFRWIMLTIAKYDIESFEYQYNSDVFMSRVPHVVLAITMYYVIIFGGRSLLRNVRPIKFGLLFKLHNLFLTLLSGGLLLLLVEQVLPTIIKHGLFFSICNTQAWTQRVEFIYYLNYLTKYYELLDTVFMVFRKRPLTFLHTYHHGATALLCFSQLNGRTPVSYVPISLNLAVHVLMYFYYLLSSCGIRPWWKAWVTRAQIIQFVIDLGFVYFASYTHFVSLLKINIPNMGRCAGEEAAAIDGCLILSSYLVLFISFYIKSYMAPAAAKKSVKEQQRKGELRMPSNEAVTEEGTTSSSTARARGTRSRKA